MLEIATLSPAPQATPIPENATFAGEYKATLDADIWPITSIVQTQASWFNQAWLEAYAQTIVAWLYDGINNQLFDLNKPIYILQVQASAGQFGLALLDKLTAALTQPEFKGVKLCYLFADSELSQLAKLTEHPYFEHYQQQNLVSTLHWQLEKNLPLPQYDDDGGRLDFSANPTVFIANGVLSQLPQMVLQVHYQDLYLAEVAKVTLENKAPLTLPLAWQKSGTQQHEEPKSNTHTQLVYRWQKMTVEQVMLQLPELAQVHFTQILHSYSQQGICQTFSLPVSARSLFSELEQSLCDGSLMLVSDFSTTSEVDITLPNNDDAAGIKLPLDFSTLMEENTPFLQWLARSHQFKKSNLMCVKSSQTQQLYRHTQQAFYRYFAEQSPEDCERIIQSLTGAIKALGDTQVLAFMRQYDYEPKLLAIFLPRLLEQGVAADLRLTWHQVLERVWQAYVPSNKRDEFVFQLGLFAIDLSYWPLARQCFLTLTELDGPITACLHNLALVAHATGQEALAKQCIELALELNPDDKQAQRLHNDITAYQARQAQLTWFDDAVNHSVGLNDGQQLKLLPLGQQSLAEFYMQYRRNDVAQRLRGVKIESFSQLEQLWFHWQQEGDEGLKAHFALIHSELGFIGGVVIDLESQPERTQGEQIEEQIEPCSTAAVGANLSFWIGCDYQGQGFGKTGVELAVEYIRMLAPRINITQLATSAWKHNTASRRILQHVGFEECGNVKGEGSEQEVFYCLGLGFENKCG
ncbi:GNAT family N-acetyltransferase [Pseudoalteromonas sp. S16_S37]|uniref:GNAT family N-acetyltransferase n=1 Tax=Pseudoalteromonas sp. S16_S37 TaxID=2720228 RepID=UPI001681AB4E|nr:GNAT family N-acetyltransferase [Pseudoalteromonas sp. S16_S37]MBD1583127.1 GNAT family N-acetyltransferase [Pseudoalteromonas sp. S16_S37]